jgi:translation initiation factor 1
MAHGKDKKAPTVYSTDHGRVCPACDQPVLRCTCRKQQAAGPARGGVRVGRETKGRKGKGVTIVSGLPLDGAELLALAKVLKIRCGSGGTVKDGVIEIQGEHRDLLLEELARRGWPAKRSGS